MCCKHIVCPGPAKPPAAHSRLHLVSLTWALSMTCYAAVTYALLDAQCLLEQHTAQLHVTHDLLLLPRTWPHAGQCFPNTACTGATGNGYCLQSVGLASCFYAFKTSSTVSTCTPPHTSFEVLAHIITRHGQVTLDCANSDRHFAKLTMPWCSVGLSLRHRKCNWYAAMVGQLPTPSARSPIADVAEQPPCCVHIVQLYSCLSGACGYDKVAAATQLLSGTRVPAVWQLPLCHAHMLQCTDVQQ
jgi:hypothetical protein